MPSMFPVGTRVILTQRHSLNEPPVGSIGVLINQGTDTGGSGVFDFYPLQNGMLVRFDNGENQEMIEVRGLHRGGLDLAHPSARMMGDNHFLPFHDQNWNPANCSIDYLSRARLVNDHIQRSQAFWDNLLRVHGATAPDHIADSRRTVLADPTPNPNQHTVGTPIIMIRSHDLARTGIIGVIVAQQSPSNGLYGVDFGPSFAPHGHDLDGRVDSGRGHWVAGEDFRPLTSEEILQTTSSPVYSGMTHPLPDGTRVTLNVIGTPRYQGAIVRHEADAAGNHTYAVIFEGASGGIFSNLGGLIEQENGLYITARNFFVTLLRNGNVVPGGDLINIDHMNHLDSNDRHRRSVPPTLPWMTPPSPSRPTRIRLDGAISAAEAAGRSIVLTDVTGDMHERGLRAGMRGTLIEPEVSGYNNIVFDSPRRQTIRVRRGYYEFVPDSDMKEPDLKMGDRIEVVFETGKGAPIGTEGVVIKVLSKEVDVDFYPYRWRYGTDLGTGNERSCARMPKYALKSIMETEAKALKPFYLVGFKDGKSWVMEDQPTYDTGKEASDAANTLAKKLGHKVQARKNAPPDEKWKEREAIRIADGTYKAMPKGWDLEPIKDHFVHLAVKNPGMIAYTPNEEYGSQDRQVFTRPGAYVQKYYPKLSKKDVARYSAIAACDGQLEITSSPEEIVKIYRLGEEGKGPDSCMKYDFVAGHSGVALPCHPVSVYGDGDISLAYLRSGERIIARCLIWQEKKIFTRAYGDIAKIIAILEAEGYTRDNFIGAKIKRVAFQKHGDNLYVVPYIDECNSVQGNPQALGVFDDVTHLTIKEQGHGQTASSTSGFMSIPSNFRKRDPANAMVCERTGEEYDRSDNARVVTGVSSSGALVLSNWSRNSARRYSYRCNGLDAQISNDLSGRHESRERGRVSRLYIDRVGGFICPITDYAYTRPEDIAASVVLADGRRVSGEVFGSQGFTCSGTGEKHMKERRSNGSWNFMIVNHKNYHHAYVESHPELRKSSAGITETEKSNKKKKGKPSPGSVFDHGVPINGPSSFGYTSIREVGQTIWNTNTLSSTHSMNLSMDDIQRILFTNEQAAREEDAARARVQPVPDPDLAVVPAYDPEGEEPQF